MIIDSSHSSSIVSVTIELVLIPKSTVLLRSEFGLYVMVKFCSCPGNTTVHVRRMFSLLENTEQLYGIVSPGHSISDLETIRSSGDRIIKATVKRTERFNQLVTGPVQRI